MCKTRIYAIWRNMIDRCDFPKATGYKDYGGRGIIVCDEWRNSFIVFNDWAMLNGYTELLTIDRIENDKNYEPGNCKWSTSSEQAFNRRMKSTNKSGYTGVSKRLNGNWKSYINNKGVQINIGTFSTAKEASDARNEYIVKNKLPHKLN